MAAHPPSAAAALLEPPPREQLRQVLSPLSSGTAAALAGSPQADELAQAVAALLRCGWRPAQLSARIGAVPSGPTPAEAVLDLLRALLDRDSPQAAWDRERAAREAVLAEAARERSRAAPPERAALWAARARRDLGLLPRGVPTRGTSDDSRRPCSGCGGTSAFFVTRSVRLCTRCVDLLAEGHGQVVETAQPAEPDLVRAG